jgi:hypothetical protein
MVLSVESQYFLEWTRTSFEESVAVLCTILLDKHLQVALEFWRWVSIPH